MFFWNSCFFNDPTDVGNLISGSSAFSKSSLNIWKFTIHILLKSGLENFEHYFTSVWDECNGAIVWTFFDIAFLWIGMKTDLFQSCGHYCVFQICWHIECILSFSSVQSFTHVWLCDPTECSTPHFPVHHQLPEPAQTQIHRVSEAIQPSHPLSSPSICLQSFPASGSFPMSQNFMSGGPSIGV